MKLSTLSHALWLSSLAAFASIVPLAHAQTPVKVNVPFAFDCGPSHLPAGTYVITSNGRLATLHGDHTTRMAIAMTFQNDKRDEYGRALFTRTGNRYTLKDIWVAGEREHLHFFNAKPKTLPEQATNDLRPESVEVALLEQGVTHGGR